MSTYLMLRGPYTGSVVVHYALEHAELFARIERLREREFELLNNEIATAETARAFDCVEALERELADVRGELAGIT